MRRTRRSPGRALPAVRRRVRRTGAVALLLLLTTAVAAVVLARVYHLGIAATVVTILVGTPALYLAWSAYRDDRRDADTDAGLSLAKVADELADAVRSQWEAEAAARRLNDPYPLPVSWGAADPSLTDPWESLVKLADSGAGWPEEPTKGTWATGPDSLAGKGGELANALARVPTGRLVVIGEPGSGKTMLMVRLVLDLLAPAHRNKGGPVPVLAGLASWDPARQDLHSWLAGQLIIDHPALADVAPLESGEGNRIQALLNRRLILLILDGLDEIPEKVRGLALTLINDALRPGERIVVTCRTEQYREVVRPPSGTPATLRAAAAIQLCPLNPDDIIEYLRHDAGPVTEDRWGFLDTLSAKSPVRQALVTPLMTGLARAIYNPRSGEDSKGLRDPVELCNSALADREEVEAHLLHRFIPAIYAPRAGSQGSYWPPEQAQRWLEFLADYMERTGTTDLAWWRLTRIVRGWRPLGTAVRSMLLFGVAWSLVAWLLYLHPQWRHGRGLRELLAGGPLGRRLVPLVTYIQGLVPEQAAHDVRSTAETIIGFFPWKSLATLEFWVALLGIGAGLLSAAFDSRIHPHELRVVKVRSLHAPSSYPRALASLMFGALAICLLPLLLLLFPGLAIRHDGHAILGTLLHMQSVWLLLLVIILWEIAGSVTFTEPVELSQSLGPADALRMDRLASLLAVLPARVFRALLIWLCFGTLVALVWVIYIASFLLCKILLGRGRNEADRFADARIWLALSRRMPWRIMKFLADAREHGVLRQSGTVYQFRHVRLQDQLAEQYPRLSRRLASASPCNIRGYTGPLWAPAAVCGLRGTKGPLWSLARTWSPNSTAPWSQPFWAVRFQEFARQALRETGARVEWAGKIHNEGPGWVQAFKAVGNEGVGRTWVVCALPGREPVLVAEPVWQALQAAGAQALQDAGHKESGNALGVLGFPVEGISRYRRYRSDKRLMRLLKANQTPGIIDVNATQIKLSDGSWGDGLLLRDDVDSDWRWKPPSSSFRPHATSFKALRHGSRLRIGAELWYSTSARLRVAPGGYETFLAKLTDSDLSRAIVNLFTQRGTEPSEVRWQRGEFGSRGRRFTWVITGTQKNPSSTASVSVQLYRFRQNTLVTARAGLQVLDVTAWREFLVGPGARSADEILPISLDEVEAFLTAAWHTVVDILPTLIVQDLFATRPEYPPHISLDLHAYSKRDEKLNRRDLRNLVDFSPLVTNDQHQLTNMWVQITCPLQLSFGNLKVRIRQALACMAQEAGFDTNHGDWQQFG